MALVSDKLCINITFLAANYARRTESNPSARLRVCLRFLARQGSDCSTRGGWCHPTGRRRGPRNVLRLIMRILHVVDTYFRLLLALYGRTVARLCCPGRGIDKVHGVATDALSHA